jgi:hypothetical protein
MARGNPDAAMLAYREALSRVHDKKDRKRVESKMKR